MAGSFRTLIDLLKVLAPEIRGDCNADWGAKAEDYRKKIRLSAMAAIGRDGFDRSPPRPNDWSISISHARPLGGWLAVPRPLRIGLDIEESARIQLRIVERTCTPEEVSASPNPAYLWPAKEAYYKALEHEQPAVIANLRISDWRKLTPDTYSFTPQADRGVHGILIAMPETLLAACLLVSN